SASRTTSWPSTEARPPSGRNKVPKIFTVVVLPAPFGPSTPYTVPPGTVRSTPSTARVEPNVLTSPEVSIAGPADVGFICCTCLPLRGRGRSDALGLQTAFAPATYRRSPTFLSSHENRDPCVVLGPRNVSDALRGQVARTLTHTPSTSEPSAARSVGCSKRC